MIINRLRTSFSRHLTAEHTFIADCDRYFLINSNRWKLSCVEQNILCYLYNLWQPARGRIKYLIEHLLVQSLCFNALGTANLSPALSVSVCVSMLTTHKLRGLSSRCSAFLQMLHFPPPSESMQVRWIHGRCKCNCECVCLAAVRLLFILQYSPWIWWMDTQTKPLFKLQKSF